MPEQASRQRSKGEKGKGPKGKGKGGDPWSGGGLKGGKGKGESKGKGKGKGKGPINGACWTCGGAHFQADCPGVKVDGKIRSLCSIRSVCAVKHSHIVDNPCRSSHGDGKAKENSHGDGSPGAGKAEESSHGDGSPGAGKAEESSHGDGSPGAGKAEESSHGDGSPSVGKAEESSRSSSSPGVGRLSETSHGDGLKTRWVGPEQVVKADEGFTVVKSRRQKREERKQQVNSLVMVVLEGVNSIGEKENEWEEIEMAVDSGATETVVGEDMLTSIETVAGEAFKKGVQYEVASGTLIPNVGEKVCGSSSRRGAKENESTSVRSQQTADERSTSCAGRKPSGV